MAAELDFKSRLDQTSRRIAEAECIDPRNKELLRDFERDRKLNDLKASTIERDLSALKVQAEHAEQPFDNMSKDDLKDLVEYIHTRYENEYTRSIHKRALRNLFKWLNDGDHPSETEWIQTYVSKGGNGKLPDELLSKDDIKAQVSAANNKRDKALIWLLYETGARIGELLDITVGDIEDRKHGKKVVIDGKTGARRVPLVESVPHLNKWLNEHPNPEKDAPLWCKIQQKGPTDRLEAGEVDDVSEVHGIGPSRAEKLRESGIKNGCDLLEHSAEKIAGAVGVSESTAKGWLGQFEERSVNESTVEKLGYRYIREKILRKTMTEAGIDKPSNPHHYRHSRASHLANEMTEAQLCVFFGWVQGSDVPAKYVHLSGRDLDDAYDRIHGLYEPDEEDDQPDVIKCWRCEELNESDRRYCGKCGAALDKDAAETAEEVQQDLGGAKIQVELDGVENLSREDIEEIEAEASEIFSWVIQRRADQAD